MPATNKDANGFSTPNVGAAKHGETVTPSDSTDLTYISRAIWVGGAGNIAVLLEDDAAPVTLSAVAAGTLLPLRARRVYSTGTTATLIVALA